MGLLTKRGMVLMEKDGKSHSFVLESVPTWEKKGWKIVEEKREEQSDRLLKLNKQAEAEVNKAQETAEKNGK